MELQVLAVRLSLCVQNDKHQGRWTESWQYLLQLGLKLSGRGQPFIIKDVANVLCGAPAHREKCDVVHVSEMVDLMEVSVQLLGPVCSRWRSRSCLTPSGCTKDS